jgi:putative membrane protein
VSLVLRWAVLAGAFWITTLIVSGIQIKDGAWNYFWVAALFGLINTFIGSILKLFTLPAVILTFGLFVFVINAAMLMLTDRWSDVITIDSFTSALIGSLLISIFSGIANKLIKRAIAIFTVNLLGVAVSGLVALRIKPTELSKLFWIPGFSGSLTTFSSVALIHGERNDLLAISYFYSMVIISLLILWVINPREASTR